jgi:G3E family GTPase
MMVENVSTLLLTGFLGSGKTTLLRNLLTRPGFHDTAIIVNELGEIGIDHHLLSFAAERTIVMPGGCICCTIREDIETALRELFAARDAGRIQPFSRLVIETTGIADPVPLLMTLRANPLALSRLAEPRVLTIVDGVLGGDTIAQYHEAESQVAQADIVVISKSDLASRDRVEALERRVADLNPWASIRAANLMAEPLDHLFAEGGFEPTSGRDLTDWVSGRQNGRARTEHAHGHDGVQAFCLTLENRLDWNGFAVWMTMLLHRHGNRILRVKGMLDVDGLPGPTMFQSAQHLVHPPLHFDSWPSADRRSRLVFILRDIDPSLIEASIRAFDRAARNLAPASGLYRPAGGGGTIAGRPIRRPTAPSWIKG